MDLSRYADLPESLPPEQIARHFEDVLSYAEGHDDETENISAALFELADRQYHSYQLISKALAVRISRWLISHWNPPTLSFVHRAAFISGALGLPEVVEFVEKLLNDGALPLELIDETRNFIHEVKPHANDPYWDLKR